MKRKNPLKVATTEFRLWSAYVCPRPLTSPRCHPESRTSDVSEKQQMSIDEKILEIRKDLEEDNGTPAAAPAGPLHLLHPAACCCAAAAPGQREAIAEAHLLHSPAEPWLDCLCWQQSGRDGNTAQLQSQHRCQGCSFNTGIPLQEADMWELAL